LITTLKIAGKEDWPIAHTGFALGAFFKAIPFRSEVVVLDAVEGCGKMEHPHFGPHQYASMPQWQEMIRIRKNKAIQGECTRFNEEMDAPFGKMRMISIRQAQDTVGHGLSERDNLYTFLA
jgi:hypothetical protein